MAQTPDRRETVGDPLALNPNTQAPDRSLALNGVRNPGQTGGDSVYQDQMNVLGALDELGRTVGAVVESKKEDWVTEGKLRYMQGATENEIKATGNKYTQQGWQSLNAMDAANRWYAEEVNALANGANQLSPEDYTKRLMDQRNTYLNNLPDDPAVRKVYVAAFDDLGTRLIGAQAGAHNEYNTQQYERNFSSGLESGSYANADATHVVPGNSPLRLSPGVVRPVVQGYTDKDIDVMTRTMLGEANGEGTMGLAAVGHVLMNRATDGNYGGTSISSVALAPKQFSAWNSGAGGNNPSKWDPNSPAYQQARAIAVDVLSGRVVDPTNGATHYYSPRGMDKLVADGDQANRIPKWLQEERQKSGGEIVIGGHIFVGRAKSFTGVANAPENAPAVLPNAIEMTPEGKPIDPDTGFLMKEDDPRYAVAVDPQNAAPEAVADAAGVVTADTPSPAQTQIQEFIRKGDLPPERKAAIVAEQMVTQLSMGDDQLFNDAGGLGILKELGAEPGLIRQVHAAHENFTEKKNNEFNLERVNAQDALLTGVKTGDVTLADAQAQIQSWYDDKSIDSPKATQLANQVIAQDEQFRATVSENPQVRRGIASIYRDVQAGDATAEEAQARVEALAADYDIPPEVVSGWVGSMWQAEQTEWNQTQTQLRKAETDRVKDQDMARQVDFYLNRGAGLGTLSGTMSDGTDIKQFAVNQIRERTTAAGRDSIQGYIDAGMSPEEAEAKASAVSFEQFHQSLMKQDLVDTEMQAAFTGAARGEIVGPDGKVSPSALAAFDSYMQMTNNPNLGPVYASTYLQHDDARDMFTLASQLYASDNDLERSMLGAHSYLRGGQGRSAENVVINQGELRVGVAKALNENWGKYLGGNSITSGEERYAKNNVDDFANIVQGKALGYALEKDFVPMSVHIQKATEDVMKDTFVIGGNLVYSDSTRDPANHLPTVMGLEGRGADAPNAAIREFLTAEMDLRAGEWRNTGKDENGWGKTWAEATEFNMDTGLSMFGRGASMDAIQRAQGDMEGPPYYVQYDSATKNFHVYLWKDSSRTSTVDQPFIIPAAEAGANYVENHGSYSGPIDLVTNVFVDMVQNTLDPNK